MRKIIPALIVGAAITVGGLGATTASASNFKPHAPHSSNFVQHDSNFKSGKGGSNF